jgi:UDP-N-acetylmuramate dehydrogenase
MREDVPLAPLTTMGIGGPARFFMDALDEADVLEAVCWATDHAVPLFVLGGGSNLLVKDAGFDGLVLRMALLGVRQLGAGLLEVAAGESWDGFVDHAIGLGLAGVECMAGIPGTVGGTPVQNVGAYGQEVSETIIKVRAFDGKTGQFVNLSKEACKFRYRGSVFNTEERGRYIVSSVLFDLRPDGEPTLRYKDLQQYFQSLPEVAEGEEFPSLPQVADAVRRIRHGKGMLIVPGEADCRSAGSFFKNPVVDATTLERVVAAAGGVEVPRWPAPDGLVKLPAAWLLEHAGFVKGYGDGPVGISSRHTLALINRGGATFADVQRLEREIVGKVQERFGIRLEREPVLLG